jgi:hypothetical protein
MQHPLKTISSTAIRAVLPGETLAREGKSTSGREAASLSHPAVTQTALPMLHPFIFQPFCAIC